MKAKKSFLKSPKFWALSGFMFLLVLMPIFLFATQQREETRQNAYVSPSGTVTDSCHKINIKLSESPSCPRLTASNDGNNTCTIPDKTMKNDVSTYTLTINLTTNDGHVHKIKYKIDNYFCTSAYGDLGVGGKKDCHCSNNPSEDSGIVVDKTVEGDESTPPIIIQRSSTTGTSCGSYQFDFFIVSVDGNTSCKSQSTPGGVGHCDTGVACGSTTPTPTTPACTPPSDVSNIKISCPNC